MAPGKFLTDLKARNPILYYFGGLYLAGGLFCIIMTRAQQQTALAETDLIQEIHRHLNIRGRHLKVIAFAGEPVSTLPEFLAGIRKPDHLKTTTY